MPLQSGNLTRDEARARAALLSDISYAIELDLREQDETFRSRTTIDVASADPGAETFVDVTAHSIERLEVNGERVEPEFDGSRLQLPGLAEQNRIVVESVCGYEHTGQGLHQFRDPEDGNVYLHTQFEPFDAHRVFACFDQPDLKARFTISAEAPPEWDLVSNTAPTAGGGGRWDFAETPLLSPYLVALVAGRMHVVRDEHEGTPLAIWSRQSMAKHVDADELFELTKQGLDFYTDVFAMEYPFEKYDQLFVPEFSFGAMENPGCVTFHEHYLFRGHVTDAERESRATTLLHEMAHMWFGDLVTMRWWDDLWLNESFATYMATLAVDRATRFPNAWVTFSNDEKAWARYQDQLPTTHPVATDAPDVQTGFQNFDGITYAKGASVLRQLAAWVGGDEFLDGCRRYFERHAWGNASLADFLGALEDASGRRLGGWAESWLETTGMNTLRLRTDVRDSHYVDAAIEQSAPEDHPTIRPHRLQVGTYDLRDDRLIARERIDLDIDTPSTPVLAMEGQAQADLVLLNDGDLTFAKVEFDERSMRTVETHLAALDDPLARTLCWATAWEMVRDAVLPARRFAELVRANIPREDDIGVVQTLHGRGRTAVELYGDPRNADAVMTRFADDAQSEMDRSDPGSDRQLAWARQWISSARTDEHAGTIVGLLNGGTTIDGLDVDTELRWRIVASLAARGVIGEAEIAAEHERDPSDLGARRADAARASLPMAEAKETAWSRVVDDPALSHSDMKAIMGGFSQRTQEYLIRPFVPRYFEVLPRIWEERQLEIALDIAERLYPTVVDDDVVARTDRFLEGEVARPLRRTLLEQRDTIVRALRTRALDASHQ